MKALTVGYNGVPVLEGVTAEVPLGSITAIIGPNGSGKTTLMRAMLGLIPVMSGEVLVSGRHPHDIRGFVGYVPQRFAFDRNFPITVREFIALAGDKNCTSDHIDEVVKEVGLLPTVLSQTLGTLSGGQLQRVLIAQAIIRHPPIVFMDEPAAGIDVAGEAVFYDVIEHLNKDHGTTIVLVSHDLSVISKVVTHVICVNRKLLCEGPPGRTLTKKKIGELYGFDAHLH